ncbi:MAG: CBS domain-containing protein [bacterium]|nr:CBS domain-containing protein [bacterium]
MKYLTELEEKLTDEQELRKAFALARKLNVIELPVFSEKEPEKYLGMVDLRPHITFSYDVLRTKLKHVIVRYNWLIESEFTPKEAARIMVELNYRAVPVVSDESEERLVGVCYDRNVLEYLSDQGFGRKIKIKTLGLSQPITISPNDTIAKAITLMRRHHIGRLPVVEHGKLVGIVTRMSIFNLVVSLDKERPEFGEYVDEKHSVYSYPVREVMDYPVYTVSPESSVLSAIQLMLKYNIRGLVVAEEEKPVAVITSKNIISLFVKQYIQELEEKGVFHEVHADDPDIRAFIERCLKIKRFPEGCYVKIYCLKRASTKNIYDIRIRLRLPNGQLIVYADVARGKAEAYRRIKKAIETVQYEAFEEKKPEY